MDTPEKVVLTHQVMRFKEVEYPTVYSNIMGIGITPYDISIVFGEVDLATKEEVLAIPRVKVLLSPEQVANLVQMLTTTLKNFTDGNGPLRQSGRVTPEAMDKAFSAKPQ